MSLYPPFLGAGVRVRTVGREPLAFEVTLVLRWWNRNAVGTQFGGSLYAMADPFFMLILLDALGDRFDVWDKAATIRFRRPGRGRVRARFEIARERIAEIRAEALDVGRAQPVFRAEIRDEAGELVAEVEKTISVRPRKPEPASA
jgi:acyl-coenzyme A thioesterase PaaI-like protein